MKISACLIVKNEEKLLPQCLKSIRDWVDEIIVVDTGSTDKTMSIARSFEAVVYEQAWQDDFSFHRNYSISKATGDWIFIIDADEEVPSPHGIAIKEFIENDKDSDVLTIKVQNVYGAEKSVRSTMISMRFFKKSTEPRYDSFVHNRPQIKQGSKVKLTGFRLLHYGYGLEDKKKMAEKYKRMVTMCKKNMDDNSDSPMAHLYYARSIRVKDGAFNKGAVSEMMVTLLRGVELCNGKNSEQNEYIQLLYATGIVEYTIGHHRMAAIYGHEALKFKPDYLDAIMLLGYAYTYGIDHNEGEKWFRRYLSEQERYIYEDKLDALSMENSNGRIEAYKSLIDIENLKNKKSVNDESLLAGTEKSSDYYDDIYSRKYNTRRYQPIYKAVVKSISQNGTKVLELGCGTGDLAVMIEKIGKPYSGFDFSRNAIKVAKKRGAKNVFRGNIYDPIRYSGDYNTVIGLEVFEHIDDIDALALIPIGKRVIISVPNFPDVAHKRIYESPDQIAFRWQALLRIEKVDIFDMGGDRRIFLCYGEKIGVDNGN